MKKRKLLIVDDEEFNLDIMEEYIGDAGFLTIPARNGLEAWNLLQEHPDVQVIVLDRMMPVMDGMAFLEKIKQERRYREIPIIMQTAAASPDQIYEGMKAGVFYYLTKPYEKDLLLNVINAAMQDIQTGVLDIDGNDSAPRKVQHMIRQAQFEFKTPAQARELAGFIAGVFPDPGACSPGLNEMMMNAIEHGNLAISYDEKRRLLMTGQWKQEIERRLNQPEYQSRRALAIVTVDNEKAEVVIQDEGKGFDYRKFNTTRPEHITELNGRGIAIARMISFDSITYEGCGNTVRCITAHRTQAEKIAI